MFMSETLTLIFFAIVSTLSALGAIVVVCQHFAGKDTKNPWR